MQYQHSHRRISPSGLWRSILLWFFGIALLVLILFRPLMPMWLSVYADGVFGSVYGVALTLEKWSAPLSTSFTSKEALTLRVRELEGEIQKNELAVRTATLTERNDETLRALMSRTLHETPIAAGVLLRPSQTLYDTLIIDAGRAEGVKEGYMVQTPEGVVVGDIDRVFEHRSRVVLFSSPQRETVVRIGGAQVEVMAVGRGGGNFEATIPRTATIAKGDIVIMPGLSTRAFAVVEEIIVRPSDSSQRILFKNPINMFEVSLVAVIPEITKTLPEFITPLAPEKQATSTQSDTIPSD